MSHTPGPWVVWGVSSNDGESEVVSNRDGSKTICWTADTYNEDEDIGEATDEDLSNARLIAAAPELLAFARMAIEYANDTKDRFSQQWDGEDEESYSALLDAADKAIDKAEGRSE